MNENPYVLEYSFVPTECGNFVITSKELKDDVYSILGGFSYGDNIDATGVFFVGELEMPNVEDFVNWAKEVEREYLAGKDVEHASVKVIRAHQSMEQVSEQHAIFRSFIQVDPQYFIDGTSLEEQQAELVINKEASFSELMDALEQAAIDEAEKCDCDNCKEFLAE